VSETPSKALIFTILRHAEDFPWRMQDIGLLGLRLDDRREYRLHIWDPTCNVGEPPIHDHPYDFTSDIIVGELTNTRYEEVSTGDEYVRFRYSPSAEDLRRSEMVRLSGKATTYGEGGQYHQFADELHASCQLAGTVTLIRCSWAQVSELSVCLRDESSWRSGQARPATREEIKAMVNKALDWF
jgi:hypothetical protein